MHKHLKLMYTKFVLLYLNSVWWWLAGVSNNFFLRSSFQGNSNLSIEATVNTATLVAKITDGQKCKTVCTTRIAEQDEFSTRFDIDTFVIKHVMHYDHQKF